MYRIGNHFKKLKNNNNGATLVELVIYITISAIILVELSGILSQLVYDQTKVEAITRQDEVARSLMRTISRSVEEAQTINSPYGPDSVATILNITDRNNNTIVYSQNNGIVYETINSESPTQISSGDVYVKTLQFTVESEAGVSPSMNIQIDIQQTATNASNLSHYETTDAQRVE